MFLSAFRTHDYRLSTFKSHAWTHLEWYLVIFKRMLEVDRIKIENVQWAFTRELFGISYTPIYRARCELLGLERLWIRRVKLWLAFLFNLCRNNVHSSTDAIRDAGGLPYPICSRRYSLNAPWTRLSTRTKSFTVVYCKFWNNLISLLNSCSNLTQFKTQLEKLLGVSLLVNLTQANIGPDKAYKHQLQS